MLRLSWKTIRSPNHRGLPRDSALLIPAGFFALAALYLQPALIQAAEIRDDLPQAIEQLAERLEGLKAADDHETMGVVKQSADQAFALAEQNLKDQEYIAVIRNLNFVLNQVPRLPHDRYLKAQYMLGTAYEELRQMPRAGKAWLRYLSSYTTQKGDDTIRLLEVIRHLLLVQEQLAEDQRTQFQRLLADITALQMAPEIRAEIHLLAAISAIHGRQNRLATSWLDKVKATKVSQRLWAEAGYYAGLNFMQQGDVQAAEKAWLELAAIGDDSLIMVRDLAALNLGRLYAARKMPKNALQWYSKVKSPGISSRMASYEVSLLLAQTSQYPQASQFAQSYISNYPKTKEAFSLQEKLPLFLYQSGHLDLAETQLKARDKELTELKEWLEVTTRGRLAMNASDLLDVDQHLAKYAISSPIIDRSLTLFQRLEKQLKVQQEQRNELRSMMLTLGRVLDPELRPRIASTNRQLNQLIDQWSSVGERLVAGEKELYGNQLSAAEQLSLDRSSLRRKKLQDLSSEFQRRSTKTWQELSQTSLSLGELARRLERHQAELSAIMLKGQSSNHQKILEQSALAKDYAQQIAALQARANSLVEQHRKRMLSQQLTDSPYQVTRKRLLLYAQEFLEAEAIFAKQRDSFNHPMKKHAQEDYQQTWNGWRSIAGQTLSFIYAKENQEKAWLNAQIKTFDRLNQKSTELHGRQLELERRLAILSGKVWPSVLDHTGYHINEQQARAKKWLADLQWQRSMDQAQKRSDLSNEQDRKEMDLQEGLKDMELEGALHE